MDICILLYRTTEDKYSEISKYTGNYRGSSGEMIVHCFYTFTNPFSDVFSIVLECKRVKLKVKYGGLLESCRNRVHV